MLCAALPRQVPYLTLSESVSSLAAQLGASDGVRGFLGSDDRVDLFLCFLLLAFKGIFGLILLLLNHVLDRFFWLSLGFLSFFLDDLLGFLGNRFLLILPLIVLRQDLLKFVSGLFLGGRTDLDLTVDFIRNSGL